MRGLHGALRLRAIGCARDDLVAASVHPRARRFLISSAGGRSVTSAERPPGWRAASPDGDHRARVRAVARGRTIVRNRPSDRARLPETDYMGFDLPGLLAANDGRGYELHARYMNPPLPSRLHP